MSAYTIAIICPSCGGNASLTEGAQVVHCPYCDYKSLASSPLGYPTLYLPPKISQEDARLIAEKYVHPETNPDNPPPPPVFHQIQLLFIPFWRVQARMIGWVSGQAPVKEEVIEGINENGERPSGWGRKKIIHTGGEPLKKMLVHLQQYTIPAAEVKELGVLRLHWEGKDMKLAPFKLETLKQMGHVITPSISVARIQREAETIFLKRVLNPYREYTDFFHRLKLLHPQVTLFYYPFWVVTGLQEGYFIRRVIDAHDGTILATDAPLPPLAPKSLKTESLAVSAGVMGFTAGNLLKQGFWGVVLLLFLVAFIGGMLILVRWESKEEE